jgi:hypothetical protein
MEGLLTIGIHRVILGGESREIRWEKDKDARLKMERGIGFEQVAAMLERDDYIDIVDHWNIIRHPAQRVFVLEIDGYGYYVPFAETPIVVFLKTIFPSRKATKLYLKRN